MFNVDIPALPPPAGSEARTRLHGLGAPAIRANDPIDPSALAAASEEYWQRRCWLGRSDITLEEVVLAEARLHAVHMDANVSQLYQGNQPMLAAAIAPLQRSIDDLGRQIEDLARQFDRRLTTLESSAQQIDRRVTALENSAQETNVRLTAIEARLQSIEDSLNSLQVDAIVARNRERRAFNWKRQGDTTQHLTPHQTLQPLLKSQVEEGSGIPGLAPVHPPVVQLGAEFPSPPFPATIGDIGVMTMAQIHELAVMMNDNFGIIQGDDVQVCRMKLTAALTAAYR